MDWNRSHLDWTKTLSNSSQKILCDYERICCQNLLQCGKFLHTGIALELKKKWQVWMEIRTSKKIFDGQINGCNSAALLTKSIILVSKAMDCHTWLHSFFVYMWLLMWAFSFILLNILNRIFTVWTAYRGRQRNA